MKSNFDSLMASGSAKRELGAFIAVLLVLLVA